jgi:hypothetical protein
MMICLMMIIAIGFILISNMNQINGPCLEHCYKKYNIFIIVFAFLFGYFMNGKKLMIT